MTGPVCRIISQSDGARAMATGVSPVWPSKGKDKKGKRGGKGKDKKGKRGGKGFLLSTASHPAIVTTRAALVWAPIQQDRGSDTRGTSH